MSIQVDLERLEAQAAEQGTSAYVMTVSPDDRPHVVRAPVTWTPGGFVAEVGTRTAANAMRRGAASLLFPVRSDDDYSLIVDGTAVVEPIAEGYRLLIGPACAVLHRPVPAGATVESACGSDCIPLVPVARLG